MRVMKQSYWIFVIILSLFACEKEQEINAEDTAIAFFDAIYNQKDLNKALALSTPRFAKKLSHYVTVSQVARQFFHMSYDSVHVTAGLGDFGVREEFRKSGILTLLFTGTSHDKRYKALKKIKLVKVGKIWLVDQLLPDPMPR